MLKGKTIDLGDIVIILILDMKVEHLCNLLEHQVEVLDIAIGEINE
jgi:hypothetical protein